MTNETSDLVTKTQRYLNLRWNPSFYLFNDYDAIFLLFVYVHVCVGAKPAFLKNFECCFLSSFQTAWVQSGWSTRNSHRLTVILS